MPLHLTDDKSTLVQVMAWCRQATSHYLSQCWPRSVSPNGVTRPQSQRYLEPYLGEASANFSITFILDRCRVDTYRYRYNTVNFSSVRGSYRVVYCEELGAKNDRFIKAAHYTPQSKRSFSTPHPWMSRSVAPDNPAIIAAAYALYLINHKTPSLMASVSLSTCPSPPITTKLNTYLPLDRHLVRVSVKTVGFELIENRATMVMLRLGALRDFRYKCVCFCPRYRWQCCQFDATHTMQTMRPLKDESCSTIVAIMVFISLCAKNMFLLGKKYTVFIYTTNENYGMTSKKINVLGLTWNILYVIWCILFNLTSATLAQNVPANKYLQSKIKF